MAVIVIAVWIVAVLLAKFVRFLLHILGQLLLCILLNALLIAYFLFGRDGQ